MHAPRLPRCLWVLALTVACAHREPQRPPPVQADPPPKEAPAAAPLPAPGPEADARAEAAFHALEPSFEALLAIPFDDPKRLKAALTTRMQGLLKLEREYLAITRLGSKEWAMAALVRLGESYEDLARAFRDAAGPAGLSTEQLAIFRTELATRAVPLETKAAGAYQQAIALEEQSAGPSDWVLFARERLARLEKPGP